MNLISAWTIKRATNWGTISAFASLALLAINSIVEGAAYERLAVVALEIALAITALCGLSILVMTLIDVRNHRRGQRVRAVRTFDVAFGVLLAMPSIAELRSLVEWW